MRQADGEPEIPELVRAHVDHALTALLRPDELDGWGLRWAEDDESDRRFLCVDLVAVGEPHIGYLYEENADYPIEEALDIFTDGLEDFIAESRFAWGQQRLLADRPWRNVP